MEVDAAVDLPEPNKRPRLDEEGDAAAGDSAPTEPLEGAAASPTDDPDSAPASRKQKPIYAPQAPRVRVAKPKAPPAAKSTKPRAKAVPLDGATAPAATTDAPVAGQQAVGGPAPEVVKPAVASPAPRPLPEGDTPDGVPLYGCPKCRYLAAGCAKCLRGPTVRSRWQPEKAHAMHHIPAVPTYTPTDAEWDDPFSFVARIRPEAERYGICKIVAPPGWKPGFWLPNKDELRFPTRIQAVHELQNRQPGGPVVIVKRSSGKSAAKKAAEAAAAAAAANGDVENGASAGATVTENDGTVPVAAPTDTAVETPVPVTIVTSGRMGGGMPMGRMGGGGPGPRKTAFAGTQEEDVEDAMQPASHEGPSAGHLDTSAPADALQPAADGSMPVGAEEAPAQDAPPAEPEEPPPYGFRPGEQHSLASLERYSRFFKAKYFCTKTGKPKADLQLTDIEAEFWRLVEDSSSRGGATGVAEVVYGADIQTSEVGSGFPSEATSNGDPALLRYAHAPANVCNMPFQPGSCLRHVEKTTGISVPWLYFGMTLSAFCWHVEDHHFYSVNYHHFGAPKVWYSVPASHSARLEAYMQSKLPHLFAAQPGLLHALVTLVSPQALVEAGIPVYRAVQEPGCYIITFPFAYHAGFNAGFNCAEATNFAPADWLPFGLDASERYSQDARYCSVAHDKMLMELGTAAACSSNGKKAEEAHDAATVHPSLPPTIAAELDRRTLLEVQRRGGASCWVSGEERMSNAEVAFCADNDCAVCLADLHISAIFCKCSPDQPTCLRHVGCACRASDRTLKFKYSLQEMRDLAHAVRDVASDRYEVMRPLADRFDESGNGKPRRPLATRAEADAAFDNAVVRAAEEAKHCGRKRKPEPEAL